MYNIDLNLNRTYWQYRQNRSFLRPDKGYKGNEHIPSIGARITCDLYSRRGETFKKDLESLVDAFAALYNKKFNLYLALSGGIDSEITAEAFYRAGIPFIGLSLRLLDGINDFDLVYAAKYCKDRKIHHRIIKLSKEELIEKTIPKAVKHGQFTHAYSQVALTKLLDVSTKGDIIVFSGHNPDFHPEIGPGWWEDSPNLVKYAINTKKNFFTFTSLEPIFCHYAKNYDVTQPGEKNNDFLYDCYPNLTRRIKYTGWEKSDDIIGPIIDKLYKTHSYKYQTFLTCDFYTIRYMYKLFLKGKVRVAY